MTAAKKKAAPLRCCFGCGRDTGGTTGYCARCIVQGVYAPQARHDGTAARVNDPMALEDKYDEESGPDSIC